jgi:hypothetical protein
VGSQVSEVRESRSGSLLVVRGRATGVSTRILSEVFGAPSSISEVEFFVQNTLVNVRSKNGAFRVAEGDEVVAVGRREGRTLKAIGWWNCDTKKGCKPSGWYFWPLLSAAIGAAGAALLKASLALDSPAAWRFLASCGLLIALSVVGVLSGHYRQRARRLLDVGITLTTSRKQRR